MLALALSTCMLVQIKSNFKAFLTTSNHDDRARSLSTLLHQHNLPFLIFDNVFTLSPMPELNEDFFKHK